MQSLGYAQLNEDFSDGNFNVNPVWTGSNASVDFIISSAQLRSNSVQSGSSFYISTENTLALNAKWEFQVNLQFSTSGSNYTDVYLISDKADLKSTLINGYFVRIGNTDDEISLYKRSGTSGSSIKIIDGINSSVAAAANTVRVKVSRSNSGLFKLERDIISVNSAFVTEGSATDVSFTASTHFGIVIQQSTASFFQKHFFDNFKIDPIVTDTIPPVLNSAASIDSNTIELSFSEIMDSVSVKAISNFSISNNIIISQILTTADPTRFRIKLLNSLNTATYRISLQNVNDIHGNVIGANNTASFSFIRPYLAKYGDIVINEIFPDPSPQLDLPSVEFVELRNNTEYAIPLKNWKFSDPGSSSNFGDISIDPDSFLILCAKADTAEFKRFGKVLGVSPWPSLNNSGDAIKLVNSQNALIDSVSYSDSWYRNAAKKQGGWTLERIDPKSTCQGFFNWTTSVDSSGGTPGRKNSSYVSGYDQILLKADSLKQVSDTTLKVYFNKHLNNATLIPENFKLLPSSGSIKKIMSDTEFKELVLVYDHKFLPDTDYQLSISDLKDCSGAVVQNSTRLSFKTAKLPAPVPERSDSGRIIITEIFADPSPEVGLPLTEFIELFNPSKDTVDLDRWTINDPTTKATLSNQNILPQQYIILCPAADTLAYRFYGKTLGISPWPSLGNTSDEIVLKSFKKRVVDSVAYADTWYRNTAKKQGGWTLEKIDLNSICEGLFNWTASKDTSGGTPGRKNSVYLSGYDLLPLRADILKQISDSTIKVYFNKHLNSSTLVAENFNLFPNSGLITKITANAEVNEITLAYAQKFKSGTEFALSFSNLKDCSKALISNSNPLTFNTPKQPAPIPERADTSTIIITEIFADPSPEIGLPLSEFIEIFNPSKDTVNLDKWTVNDPTTRSILPNRKILPYEYLILCPAADTVHYKPFGKTIGLNPWPSLNNSADQIVLKSFKNRVVDSIAYSDAWYHNTFKKQGGWSLEKIDLNSACEDFFNWTASKDTSGGTPGRKNSVYVSGYDLLPLAADSLKQLSDTTIKIYFNKHLDSSTLIAENFSLSTFTGAVKKIIADAEVKELTLIYDREFSPATKYQLVISHIKDCSRAVISTVSNKLTFQTAKLSLPIPARADTSVIVINEIFADPSPEIGLPLAEFIEIFNPSTDTVDLNKWLLSDGSTKSLITNSTIAPGEFLILCPLADTLVYKPFGRAKGIAPWPSLGNSSDQVTLKSFKQRLVDSVAYSDKWYKDPVKKNGGWSLEKIDPLNNACDGFYNWTVSTDLSGGTPGRINSLNKPGQLSQQLRIDSAYASSDSTLTVYLNSTPDTSYLKPSQFTIDNGLIKTKTVSYDNSFKKLYLVVDSKFQEGRSYMFRADSLFNCGGGVIINPYNQVSFSIPLIPEIEYPIVINEIFADPTPSAGLPELEFVELYNPSEMQVSLKGLSYGNEKTMYKFKSGVIPAGSYLILCAEKDTLNFSGFGKVTGLPVWPSLNNDKDILILKNNKGLEIGRVAYNSSWYKDKEKQKGGFSLEMIDPASTCAGIQNWRASNDPAGGSPGKQNTVYNAGVLQPLKLIDAVFTDSITLIITFNRAVDSLTASIAANFSLNNGVGEPASSIPLSPDFDKVLITFRKAPTRGYIYKIDVKNVTDCKGSLIDINFNSKDILLTHKILKDDILISEILFNPRSGGADFVEVYNNTAHALDLQELSLATIVGDTVSNPKSLSKNQLLLGSDQYLVISSDPENIKKEYRTDNPDRFLKITSLPQFNDDMGTVVLHANKIITDRFTYTEKMHFQLLKNFEGISLERSNFKLKANESGNFRSATAASGFATPGYKNSQQSSTPAGNEEFQLSSKTFSPDNDGFEDLLQINYHLDKPGMIANVTIFNDAGTIVKKLLKNFTLDSEGVFTWDGLNEFQSISHSGIYIMYAEIFDIDGNVKRFRKSFALAVKL